MQQPLARHPLAVRIPGFEPRLQGAPEFRWKRQRCSLWGCSGRQSCPRQFRLFSFSCSTRTTVRTGYTTLRSLIGCERSRSGATFDKMPFPADIAFPRKAWSETGRLNFKNTTSPCGKRSNYLPLLRVRSRRHTALRSFMCNRRREV